VPPLKFTSVLGLEGNIALGKEARRGLSKGNTDAGYLSGHLVKDLDTRLLWNPWAEQNQKKPDRALAELGLETYGDPPRVQVCVSPEYSVL
jgi:hypothetical protein